MSKKQLSPGDTIDARCTRCRELRNHTIVALVDERPVRVKCNTCGGEHNYRPPVAEKKKPAPRTSAPKKSATRSKADPKAGERQAWETQRVEMSRREAMAYTQDGRYKVKDVVNHPVFGVGIVQQISGANKMEVLFEAGIKLLRCG